MIKLKKPRTPMYGNDRTVDEARYLTHCTNIARILADKNGWGDINNRLKMYIEITNAELEE